VRRGFGRVALPPLEACVSWLVRLYPPSWCKRYGGELEELVGRMPGQVGTALDLLIGAAIAYRDVIRANRVLSAAAAYLHGLCVAVLVQAIVFVSAIMAAQGAEGRTVLRIGPVELTTFVPPVQYGFRELAAALLIQRVAQTSLPELVLLAAMGLALGIVLAAPRLLRSLR
jgi:hypothetical protein